MAGSLPRKQQQALTTFFRAYGGESRSSGEKTCLEHFRECSFNSPPLRPSPLTRGVLEPKSGTQGPAGPSGFPEVRVPHSPGRSCPSSPGGRGRPCPFLTAKAPDPQPPPPAVHKPAPRSRARCLLIGPTTANPEPLSAVTSRLRCPGIGCGAVSVAPLPTTRTTWRRKGVVIPS